MKISLIMPVYNAEATLPASLDSLRRQGFTDFEMVFIDDCSSDGTPDIINSFALESGIPCKILRQSVNRGVAAARNRGLDEAEGEYTGFIDADDQLEDGAMKRAATILDSDGRTIDILGWDWTLGFARNGRVMRQADYDSPVRAVKNLAGGTMRWNLWMFLIRRGLIQDNGIRFIDGADMGEDMQFMIKAFLKSAEVLQIHEPLYRYNAVSESSISRQFSPLRRAQIEKNVAEAEKAICSSELFTQLEDYIDYLKLFLKRPLLIGTDRSNYKLWHSWFSESNHAAATNAELPLRIRLLQWLAARRCWSAVSLHYRIIYKFIYGFLYK